MKKCTRLYGLETAQKDQVHHSSPSERVSGALPIALRKRQHILTYRETSARHPGDTGLQSDAFLLFSRLLPLNPHRVIP